MSNRRSFLPIIAILIASVLLILPIQPVQAVGPIFEESNTLPNIENQTHIWKFVYANYSQTGFNTGDKIRWNTTSTNNSQTGIPGGWIADTIWGIIDYYNTTTGLWGSLLGIPTTEIFGFGYNPATPTSQIGGVYNLYGFTMQMGITPFMICTNLSNANHTVVNTTYTMLTSMGSMAVALIFYPMGTINNGSWLIAAMDIFIAYIYTYNSNGILTRMQEIDWWGTLIDLRLVEEKEEDLTGLLLLAMMAGGGGGLGTEMIIIIGVAAAVGIIIIIIAISKAKK